MKYIFLLFIALLVLSCNRREETIVTEIPALNASSIYNEDSVFWYKEKYKSTHKEISDSYLEKGAKELETNPEKAAYCIKRAVTLYPTLDNYKTLASVLNKLSRYDELMSLYSLLVNRGEGRDIALGRSLFIEKPDDDLFYEYCAAACLSRSYQLGDVSYQAKESGIDISKMKERLLKDERFKNDTNSIAFKNLLMVFVPYEDFKNYSASPEIFNEFLSSIKDTAAVFDIDKRDVWQFDFADFNGMEIDMEEMPSLSSIFAYYLKEKQDDPDGWVKYNFNHLFRLNDSVEAVVYSIDTSEIACPDEMRHVYHRLVTYGKSPKIIDTRIVAYQSGEDLVTLHFDRGRFVTTVHKRSWKNTYDKKDFDNYIVKTEKIKDMFFEIAPDGIIHESSSTASVH